MSDADIRREVWDGKIPICFCVDENEVGSSSLPPPEPCFVSHFDTSGEFVLR